MAKKSTKPSLSGQLGAALLKFAAPTGGMIAGLFGAGLIRGKGPPLLGFILGGAIGTVAITALIKGTFAVINPKRRK
jgi:hypothetical protein